MSSTLKRFTRYEAEFHAPETQYVLAEEHDELARTADAALSMYHAAHKLHMEATRGLEAAKAQLAALSYPVQLHTHPLLTVEAGGIRYVLEVMSDEDGEWFEVKSATPTEAQTLDDFKLAVKFSHGDMHTGELYVAAHEALATWRAEQQRNDEAERAE